LLYVDSRLIKQKLFYAYGQDAFFIVPGHNVILYMILFLLPKIQPCVSETNISEIILQRGINIFLPFYIISV